jgi:hypothetical protein
MEHLRNKILTNGEGTGGVSDSPLWNFRIGLNEETELGTIPGSTGVAGPGIRGLSWRETKHQKSRFNYLIAALMAHVGHFSRPT